MAYRLVPSQEPIPALGAHPTAEEVRNYSIDSNRVLREWYRTYQEAVNRALNLPSFRVHRNGVEQASIANTTHTKIQFNSIATSSGTEGWDSHNFFDLTTNYRFTPKIPGVYCFYLSTRFNYVSGTNIHQISTIRLNGVAIAEGVNYLTSLSYNNTVSVSTNVRLNGATDYVEFYCYQGAGSAQGLAGEAIDVYACGHKVSDLPT